MITSEQTSLLSEVRQTPIPKPVLFELESRLKHRVHSMVLHAFNKSGLTQKALAMRLGWNEARVSRCLGMAGNLTLKTISALLTAIGVDMDDPSYTSFDELEKRLKAHASAHPVESQKKREYRAVIPLLPASQPSGVTATSTSIGAIPVGERASTMIGAQPKLRTAKVYRFLKPEQNTSGRNAMTQIGDANAK